MPFTNSHKVMAKAITGSTVAGLSVLYAGLDDGSLTAQEWVGVASAALVALGAVWAVPNKGDHED